MAPRRVPTTWMVTLATPWPDCASTIRPTIRPIGAGAAVSWALMDGDTKTRNRDSALKSRVIGVLRWEVRLSRIEWMLPQPRLEIRTELQRIRHGRDRAGLVRLPVGWG